MKSLDTPLIFTLFPDNKGQTKRELEMSLREFAISEYPKAHRSSKDSSPIVKLQRYGSHRTDKGCLRNNRNVECITGVEIDYDPDGAFADEAKISIKAAQKTLADAGVAAIIIASWSHTEDAPAWHALCPTSRPLDPSARDALAARLNGLFKGQLDQHASFTLSQASYYGRKKGAPDFGVLFAEGRPIDECSDLDATALEKQTKPNGEKNHDESRSGRHWHAALKSVRAGISYEEHLARLDDELADYAEEPRSDSTKGAHDWEQAQEKVRAAQKTKIDRFEYHMEEADGYDPCRFLTAAELCSRPRPNDFVEGLMYDGLLSIWYGAPKSGKSFLLFDLATHVALGMPWANRATEQRNVLIIPLEGEGLLQDRVRAWEMHHIKKCPVVFSPFPLHLINDKDRIAEIIAYCKANNVGLIIIDTLARAMRGGNENDFADVSRALAGADLIRTITGAHVILAHHTTKDGKSARGHSDLIGNPDLLVEISKPDSPEDFRKAIVTQNRHGPEGMGLQFRVDTVETDLTNKRGEWVTSGVAIIQAEGFKDMGEAEQRDDAKLALEVLRRLYRLAPLVYDLDGIESVDWRAALDRAGLWPDTTNPNTRRSYFKRVKDCLIVAGLVDRTDSKFRPVERKIAR